MKKRLLVWVFVMLLLVGGMVWGEEPAPAPPPTLPTQPAVNGAAPTSLPPGPSTFLSGGTEPPKYTIQGVSVPKFFVDDSYDYSNNAWKTNVAYDSTTKIWTDQYRYKYRFSQNVRTYTTSVRDIVSVWDGSQYNQFTSSVTFTQITSITEQNGVPIFTLDDNTIQIGNTNPIPTEVYNNNKVNIDYGAAAAASANAAVPLKNGGSISTLSSLPSGTTGYKITSSAADTNPQTFYTSSLGAGQTATLTIPAGQTTGELVITHFDDGSIFGGTETTLGEMKFDNGKYVSADGKTTFDASKQELVTADGGKTITTTYDFTNGKIATITEEEGVKVDMDISYANGDTGDYDAENTIIYRYDSNGVLKSAEINTAFYFIREDGGADIFESNDIDQKTGLPKDKSLFDEKSGKYKGKTIADRTEKQLEESTTQSEKELSSKISWNFFLTGRSSFAFAGDVLSTYKSEQAISNLIFGKEALSQWRESVDQFFASTYLGTDYWTSEICAAEFDVVGSSVAFIETSGGVFQFIGTVNGERSEPVPLLCDAEGGCAKGTCRTKDLVCVGVDNETLTEYFYKITYGVTAPNDDKLTPQHDESGAISFNIVVSGSEKTGTLFTDFVDLDNGDSEKKAVVKYSPYLYDKVCLLFGKKPEGRSGEVSEICNNIAVSQKSFSNFNNNQGADSSGSGAGSGSGASGEATYCAECW